MASVTFPGFYIKDGFSKDRLSFKQKEMKEPSLWTLHTDRLGMTFIQTALLYSQYDFNSHPPELKLGRSYVHEENLNIAISVFTKKDKVFTDWREAMDCFIQQSRSNPRKAKELLNTPFPDTRPFIELLHFRNPLQTISGHNHYTTIKEWAQLLHGQTPAYLIVKQWELKDCQEFLPSLLELGLSFEKNAITGKSPVDYLCVGDSDFSRKHQIIDFLADYTELFSTESCSKIAFSFPENYSWKIAEERGQLLSRFCENLNEDLGSSPGLAL